MLVSFSVENWMSFRDKATLSMLASKERQHGERIPKIAKYHIRVIPIAAVYGGNASGKTNLFKALNFAKRLVVKGTQPENMIPVQPFLLDPGCVDKPCRFKFELLIDEIIFEFSFVVTGNNIEEEKLVEVSSTSEKVLYHRKNGEPCFDKKLAKNEFLLFAFKGTRDNQLFLTNSVNQNRIEFKPVYDWFKNTLVLIAPDSRFGHFEQFFKEEHPLYSLMNPILSQLDTGIVHLGGEEIPFDSLPFLKSFMSKLDEEVREDSPIRMLFDSTNDRIVISRKDKELKAKKLVTFHQRTDGLEAKFGMNQESDGTRRLIDLLPAFLQLAAADLKQVYVIDEIDRSIHTLLTRHLLENYLNACSPVSRSQLIFTTHDVLQMDQGLLRRDEMWVTERDHVGCSSLLSFSEYKDIRFDKDIRKSYLHGRLGGVPRILLGNSLSCNKKSQ